MGILDTPSLSRATGERIFQRRLVPIAQKNRWNDSQTYGAAGGITVKSRHTACYAATGIALVYANAWCSSTSGDVVGAAALTINAGIELPSNNSQICRIAAGALTDMVVQPGGLLVTTPIGVDVSAGQHIPVRTWHSADAATQYQFNYVATMSAWGEGRAAGSNVSNSGVVTAGGLGGMAPLMVLGYTDVDNPRAVVGIGDSIMSGVGDSAEYQRGFLQLACGLSIPLINLSRSGEQAATFTGRGRQYRMQLAAFGTSAVIEYGTNDIYAGGRTAAQLRANIIDIAAALKRCGIQKVFVTTLVPRNTSTDGWTSAANQTPITSFSGINPEAERQIHNAWVRAGAASPIDGVIDIAAAVEVDAGGAASQTGGRWIVGSQIDAGTATAGGTSLLTDNSRAWAANVHKGALVRITAGTGAGQIRGVYENTATQLTVSTTWTTAPDATSVYQIYSGPTADGIHPSSVAATLMASAVNTAQL